MDAQINGNNWAMFLKAILNPLPLPVMRETGKCRQQYSQADLGTVKRKIEKTSQIKKNKRQRK